MSETLGSKHHFIWPASPNLPMLVYQSFKPCWKPGRTRMQPTKMERRLYFMPFAALICPISVVEALLNGGANPAVRRNDLETTLHLACRDGRLDIVKLLIRRQGLECLTWKNEDEETPLDVLRYHSLSKKEAVASIRKHILQTYAGMMAQRARPFLPSCGSSRRGIHCR